MNRRMRGPRGSSEKVLGAAAMSRTRVGDLRDERTREDDDQDPEGHTRVGANEDKTRLYDFARCCHCRSAAIKAGTISKRSPTMPKSATSKIGASGSLLIATMVRAPFMPTRC